MNKKNGRVLILELTLFAVFCVIFYAFLWDMGVSRLDSRLHDGLLKLEEIVKETQANATANRNNYEKMQKRMAELGLFYLEHDGADEITGITLSRLQNAFQAGGVYLLSGDGKILSSAVSDSGDIDFSDKSFSELFRGTAREPVSGPIDVQRDGSSPWTLVSARIGDEDRYLVIQNDSSELTQLERDTSDWGVIYNRDLSDWDALELVISEDGTISFSSDPDFRSAENIRELGLSPLILENGWRGWVSLKGDRYRGSVIRIDDGDTYVFRAVSDREIFHTTCFIFVFCAVSVIIAFGAMRRFTVLFLEGKLAKREGRGGRQILYVRRMTGLMILILTLTLAWCVFSTVLCDYLAHTWSSRVKLESIFNPIERIDDTQASGTKLYHHYLEMQTGTIAGLVSANPDFQNSRDLKEMADRMGLKHILIFDGNGEVIASDRNYTGLTLPGDKEDPCYVFTWLLYGEPFVVCTDENNAFLNERCLLAGSPVIADDGSYHGFVMIAYDPAMEARFVSPFSIRSILYTMADLNDTFVLVIDKETMKIHAGSSLLDGMTAEAVNLTDRELKNGFTGFFRLPSGVNFGSCKEGDRFYVITAFDVSRELPKTILNGFIISLVCLVAELLYFLVLALLVKRKNGGAPFEWSENAPIWDTNVNGGGNAITRYLRRTTVLLSAVMWFIVLFKDHLFSTNSLMYYLININWPKGLDIFSFTLSIIYALLIAAAGFVVTRLLSVLVELVPPTEKTVIRMLTSFVRYAALIAAIFICASRLGAPTSSLLASAGILSIVIGLGAQSMITDILAGLTILFEGTLKVGDVIKINNTRGQVREIGVHNTSIVDLDDQNVKVISNNTIKSFTNYSRMPSSCFVHIGIGTDVKISDIEEFLPDELAAIQKELSHISGDLVFLGIEEIKSDSLILQFKVDCDSKYFQQVRRDLIRLLVSAFRRHGIDARSQ